MQLDVITLSIYRLMIDSAYRIREKCDYSDFFIASKEDSDNQIRNAEEFIMRVENFLNA